MIPAMGSVGESRSRTFALTAAIVALGGFAGCGGRSSTLGGDTAGQCDLAVGKAGWTEQVQVASAMSGVAPGGTVCQLQIPATGAEWLRDVTGGDYQFCQTQGFVWLVLDGQELRFDARVTQPDLCPTGQ